MEQADRRKLILTTLCQLDKQFGKGSVLLLGSRTVVPVSVISSGSISVYAALGIGGFPRGRVIEEQSGQSTSPRQTINLGL
jgi:recombination protein RecA